MSFDATFLLTGPGAAVADSGHRLLWSGGVNIASRHQILLALMGNAVYES
jgi:hypothetical protein